MYDKMSILFSFSFFLILEIYVFNNVILLKSQTQKLDLSSTLSLILSLILAWLINQAKPSQAQV